MTEPAFQRPPTAQQAVLAALRRQILAGELAPGQQVQQEALADRLGVSRVPVREALKILEAEGLVTYAPHRGYFVAELSLGDLLEVYRIRELLEAEAVRVAVPLLGDEDVDRLARAADACEEADRDGDLAAMTAANRALHFGLYEAAGMPRLVRLLRILWDATDVYRSLYYGSPGNRERVVDEHRALVAALCSRDAERAVRVLDAHRQHAVEHVRRALAVHGP